MKKRIIAILLSLSVFFCSLSCGKRALAAPAVGAIMAIGVLAWEIIGVCTGMYDDTAAAIGELIESGVDGFINPDSPFQQNWSAGWNTICGTIEGWFNSGEIEIVDGRVKLTYDQYLQLYGEVISVSSKPDLAFDCDYDYYFLTPYRDNFSPASIPQISIYLTDRAGQSVIPVFYSDDALYFSSFYLYIYNNLNSNSWNLGVRFLNHNMNFGNSIGGFSTASNLTFESMITQYQPVYSLTAYSGSEKFIFQGIDRTYDKSLDYLYKYDGSTVVEIPKSEFSDEDLTAGYITTTGDIPAFLKSIKGYTPSLVPPSDLDDLSDVLPTEYNPSLSFPVNPDLTRPLPNQVTVGDVPGVPDLPLSEYQAEVDTDIEVPSIICTKFPFCIPYDFIRFLGLLCSDPVAPVFRIPISTNPDNLEQWKGNQTVGEYLNTDDPLFEIDEEIVIDLSVIPLVQPICYTCFIVGFIFLLLHITPKMIQH